MTVLAFLIPVSLFLGGLGLLAFLWMLNTDQFEDPLGQAARVLSDRYDSKPPADNPEEKLRKPLDEPPAHP